MTYKFKPLQPRIFNVILLYKEKQIDYNKLVSEFEIWISNSTINAPIQYPYPYSVNKNTPIKTGTIITLAIDYNITDLLKIILDNTKYIVKPNSICRFSGDPLLTIACQNNHFEIAKMLIEKYKESIKHENFLKKSTLLKAFINQPSRNLEEEKYVFNNKPSIYPEEHFLKDRPIFKALNKNLDPKLIELLLLNGARCDVKDENGLTPFKYSEILGRKDISKMIVRSGSCPLLDILKYSYNKLFKKPSNKVFISPIHDQKEEKNDDDDNNNSEKDDIVDFKDTFTQYLQKSLKQKEEERYFATLENDIDDVLTIGHNEPIADCTK